MSFFKKTRLKATQLFQDSFVYLQEKYEQSIDTFTPASPFGQILTVVANLGEMIFFYIESIATELNITRARNIESIYGLSRLAGHDPSRGVSARGIIGLRLNENSNDIEGNFVRIDNLIELEVKETSLSYFLRFNKDFIKLEKSNKQFINVEIIQGKIERQTFTGTGNPLQSFNVITKEPTDNFLVWVKVNGELVKNVDSLYDMNYKEKTVLVKSSITGGLSIFFGNDSFGYMPSLGSSIEVTYVKTRGANGNLGDKTITLEFKESGTSSTGDDVDLNENLSINVIRNPSLGTDTEDPDFTRLIAPYASNSFVLANPNNYIYYLKKYTPFAFINAYNTKDDEFVDDDNVIYLFMLPNIKNKLTTNTDYFNLEETEFYLTEDEKEQVMDTVERSGRQLVTSELIIKDPKIKRYSLNIILRYFTDSNKQEIRNEIRSELNTYFLNVNRIDRIPRSDIIAIIENIEGVDSVNLFFISEQNEKAMIQGFYEIPVYGKDPNTNRKVLIEYNQTK